LFTAPKHGEGGLPAQRALVHVGQAAGARKIPKPPALRWTSEFLQRENCRQTMMRFMRFNSWVAQKQVLVYLGTHYD